jgi:RNA recognition motif-containing protein
VFRRQKALIAMKIYVGNLAYRTSEDDLRREFERYGSVSQVDVISDRETGRSKGFGFVEMPNDNEANAAIQALDGANIGERTLKVNEARPKAPRESGGGGSRGGGGGGYRGGGGGGGYRGDRGGRY